MSATPPVPFVVGSGRSGTTLLRVMLDSHPEMAVPPEAFFPVTAPAAWTGRDGADRAAAALEAEPWFADWELPPGTLRDAVARAGTASYADVLRCLFGEWAAGRGKARYGSKTPQHVLAIAELAELFPEARFVHVVRDGRDVAMSFLDVHFGPSDVAEAARVWAHRVKRGRSAGTALGPERYQEVRYEDLLECPERELRRISAFLDLAYDDAMLRYHERDPMAVAGVGDRYYHGNVTKPPIGGLRDWRAQMPRADVLLFESIAGPALERFGYERAGIVPSGPERLRVGARRGVLRTRRRLRSLRRRRAVALRRLLHA